MKTIAIVPARSGSKGLKNKNIISLCGKPLISYTLEAAIESEVFDEVMVSTDSELYRDVALQTKGVNVPFLRSKDNSGDLASSWDVVREVLNKYNEIGCNYDMFCILQPTSPLRTSDHIKEAYELYITKQANSIVSVCKMNHSINICNQLPEDGSLVGFIREPNKHLRQMSPDYYRLNGSIYMCDTKAFLEYGTIYKERSFAYIMEEKDSVDIDVMDDLFIANALMEKRLGLRKVDFSV